MSWSLSFVDFVPQFLTSCDTSTKDAKNHKVKYHCYDGRVLVAEAEVHRENTTATLVCFLCQRKKTLWSSTWSESVRATFLNTREEKSRVFVTVLLAQLVRSRPSGHRESKWNLHIYFTPLEILKKGSSRPPVTLISAARETAVLIVLIRMEFFRLEKFGLI